MLLIYGKRTAKIKTYSHHLHTCESCGGLDLKVTVHAEYGHLMFIPFYPTGDKSSKIHCNGCRMPMRYDSLQREYEKKSKPPFYLFSGPLVIIAAFASIVLFNQSRF